MDLVALPAIYSEEEIADSGLREKVAFAKKQVDNLVIGTASDLSNFGISTQEVSQMVQERINGWVISPPLALATHTRMAAAKACL
jgi:hypothetical protein